MRDALGWVESEQEKIVATMAEEIEANLVHFIEPRHHESVLDARVVVERWPYPEQLDVGRALSHLLQNAIRAEVKAKGSSHLPAREQFPSWEGLPYWHDSVPPDALVAWAREQLDALLTRQEAKRTLARIPLIFRRHAKPVPFGEALHRTVAAGSDPAGQAVPLTLADGRSMRVPVAGLALLWLTNELLDQRAREVRHVVIGLGQQRGAVPHALALGRASLHHLPVGQRMQETPLEGHCLHAAVVNGLLALHGADAAHEWAALQYLFTREGARGACYWSIEDHFVALGAKDWLRRDSDRTARIEGRLRQFSETFIAIDGRPLEEPVLQCWPLGGRPSASLQSARLALHECLLPFRVAEGHGDRVALPRRLLHLPRRPNRWALALGLNLATLFNLDGSPLQLSTRELLELAGVGTRRLARLSARMPHALRALKAVKLLTGASRRKRGAGLGDIWTLRASRGWLETPSAVPVGQDRRAPRTGLELSELCQETGLTRAEFAKRLGVSVRQLRRWTRAAGSAIPVAARRAVSEGFLFMD